MDVGGGRVEPMLEDMGLGSDPVEALAQTVEKMRGYTLQAVLEVCLPIIKKHQPDLFEKAGIDLVGVEEQLRGLYTDQRKYDEAESELKIWIRELAVMYARGEAREGAEDMPLDQIRRILSP